MRPREERSPTQFDSLFPISAPVPRLHVLFLNTLIVLLPLPPFLTPHLNVTSPCPLVSSLWSLWTLPQPVPVLPGPSPRPCLCSGYQQVPGEQRRLQQPVPGHPWEPPVCLRRGPGVGHGWCHLPGYEVPRGAGRPGSGPQREGAEVSNQR